MEPEAVRVKLGPVRPVAVFNDEAEAQAEVFGAERPDHDVAVGKPGYAREPFLQKADRLFPALRAEAGTLYGRFEVAAIVIELVQVSEPSGVFAPVGLAPRHGPPI